MQSLSANPSEATDWMLIRRLLALSWRYRWGCLQVLALGGPFDPGVGL